MNQARRATREKWRQIILSQRGSDQTVAAYCRERGIGQASFFAWKRRLRAASGTTGFVEVKAAADTVPADADGEDEKGFAAEGQAWAIEVCVRGGRLLRVRRGVDRELLIETIHVLEGLA
jgi:hypothetical protein